MLIHRPDAGEGVRRVAELLSLPWTLLAACPGYE